MKLKFNDEFICTKINGALHITSIYPDNNEIFKFKGNTSVVLDLFLKDNTSYSLSETKEKLGIEINEEDWNNFISFLVDKKILL